MKLYELQTLTEATMSNALKTLDVTKLTVKDLLVAMDNAGFEQMDNGKFMATVYGGYKEKLREHIYHWLWMDEDTDDQEKPFAINTVFVYLDKNGKVCCDPSAGHPDFDGMTKDEAVKKLASLKKA
jgi:hypothetical protein